MKKMKGIIDSVLISKNKSLIEVSLSLEKINKS